MAVPLTAVIISLRPVMSPARAILVAVCWASSGRSPIWCASEAIGWPRASCCTSTCSAAPCRSCGPWKACGRFVAFSSFAANLVPVDTNESIDIFLRNRERGETYLVSTSDGRTQGNGSSQAAALSGTGRYVAFQSDAMNLVPGDTNGEQDYFCATARP